MPRYRVVLVEPREGGNVGAVARVMANLGYQDLVLVRPGSLEGAYRRAMHGRLVLKNAEVVADLTEAIVDADLTVGTTAIPSFKEEAFHRHAVTPWELAARLRDLEGTVALLFGREDFGLSNEDLDRLDALVHIPTQPAYPVLNLSHAAALVLYELYKAQALPAQEPPRTASGREKERLHRTFRDFLEVTDYPPHKRRRTAVLFRRLMGRAAPSKWEFHALMGVFQGGIKAFRRSLESRGPDPSS
ncbi:MAG: RNA methyltransferase [Thermoplasmata archaeon]|nr:RNA methyltransferase [Thermoplasmata archaeon]